MWYGLVDQLVDRCLGMAEAPGSKVLDGLNTPSVLNLPASPYAFISLMQLLLMVMAFEVLNRLRWKGGIELAEIVILHRGAPGDRKAIPGKQLTGLDRHYFWYSERGMEITIPLHRIREIRLEGKPIWERKEKPEKQD
jgi:uncharacterized protein (UPF0248 family)